MNYLNEKRLNFTIDALADKSAARACTFTTMHNTVRTPVFMPVATSASIRTQNLSIAECLDFPVLLANTYHLFLRPGMDVFKKIGGIHSFMNWKNSVLTDSGGFQIFSLSQSFTITDDGARFKSYTDGKEYLLSPELSIEIQRAIGSDIMMVLDQCIPSTSEEKLCKDSVERTARWAERSFAARGDSAQSMFGIIQGACFPKLRKVSAQQITSLPFDGFAIGGLAVGESDSERRDMTEYTAALLPHDYPRYLMGVGTPLDLLEAVHRGVDMFDCILPTALAQQGVAYTSAGKIELRRSVHKFADRPLDESCTCQACRSYSRAYLHHLIKVNDYFGANLIGQHNLAFYKKLMDDMRTHIIADDFISFYNSKKNELSREDDENPRIAPKVKYRKNKDQLGDYEVVRHSTGYHSIRQKSSGETMHSVTEPMTEAMNLYVGQSGIHAALAESSEEYVIWDVGLGAATNAMATILEAEKIFADGNSPGKLAIISFENDMDSMRLTVMNPSKFSHVRHPAPASLLDKGSWTSTDGKIEWTLIEGSFPDTFMEAKNPDCIYYDLFSLNNGMDHWNDELFAGIYSKRKKSGTRLITYSVSTRVRSALLSSGFFVAMGAPSGPKADTTVAFSDATSAKDFRLLGKDWLERWKRSTARFAKDSTDEEKTHIERLVTHHEQFTLMK